jgi:hypothetical protein
MRHSPHIIPALFLVFASATPAAAQVPNLGTEFVLFVDSTNSLIPDVEPDVVADPDDPTNPVLRLDYANWRSVALAFDEAEGADMSAMVSDDPAATQTLNLRLRVDPELQGRGVCEDGVYCLSLTLFDSFSGPQDRESIDSGAGDAAMRLKWYIPDSLRDGAWHDLQIPLPPTTLAALEGARTAGSLTPQQARWHYGGAWAATYGIGCCGSQFPTSQDSLWREFDWARVARLSVQFDFSDAGTGSVYLDDWYVGGPSTDLSELGVAQPIEPAPVFPEDGADELAASLTLSWSGRAGAPHELQVSGDADFATKDRVVTVDGNSALVEALAANEIYYWRVRATGHSTVSAWTTVRSFRIAGISVPETQAPEDGAVGVDTEPTFSWQAVDGAISYRWQLSGDSDFSSLISDEAGIPGTTVTGPRLDTGTTYLWRVRAESVQGAGAWSPPQSFQTVQVAPLAPTGLLPPSGSLDLMTDLTLTWNGASGAATYQVQVSLTADFASPQTDVEIVATRYALAGLVRGGTYRWRVRAINTGGASGWVGSSFSTEMDPPQATRPSRPSDGAIEAPLTLTLGWDLVETASLYRIQISHSVSFDSPVVDTTSVGSDSLRVGPLRPYRVHFWRVQAANRGGESPWSDIHTFRTSLNQAPVAMDDSVVGPEDVPLDVAALANDQDPDQDPLQISAHTSPVNGYAYVSSPGTIRYVPFENWSGVDSLRYSLDDGRGGLAEAWIRVEILPVNDPPGAPTIMLPPAGSVLNVQGDPARLFTVLWNPTLDIEGEAVTYRWEMSYSPIFTAPLSVATQDATNVEVTFGEIAAALTGWGFSSPETGSVYHRVVASDGSAETPGETTTLPVIRGIMTASETEADLPTEAALEGLYPNPASQEVTLRLAMPATQSVQTRLVDTLGREILVRSQTLDAGRHSINLRTQGLPAGLYLVVVDTAGRRLTRRLLVTH